jgi:tetratricopeptide (TPR) repeat protein
MIQTARQWKKQSRRVKRNNMEENIHFFVSFSSRDKKFVREIMAALKGQGLDFWDYSDIVESIEVGERIDKRLSQQIDACTHMIVVLSENSMDRRVGRYCRFELEYAYKRKKNGIPHFIPVLVESNQTSSLGFIRRTVNRFIPIQKKSKFPLKLKPPYDIFTPDFCSELDETPESIVNFTVKVCKIIGQNYVVPIEAHANLPFWKLFRKEVADMAHSNKVHVDVMMTLGEFNEYYKRVDLQNALLRIDNFITTCAIKVPGYKPFYPRIVKAVCETELGMFDEALKSYETAKIIHPENQDVIGGIGTVYFSSREYRKAADCFEHIIKTNKTEDISNARINLIITKQHMGTFVSTEEDQFLFSVKIDTYPDDLKTAILNSQAVQLKIKKNYQALEKHCKEILSKNLHDTVTIRLLQGSYISRGMNEAARKVISDALKEAEQNVRLDEEILKGFQV